MKLERDWSEEGEMSSCAKCNSSFVSLNPCNRMCKVCYDKAYEETHEEIRQIIDKLKRKEDDE